MTLPSREAPEREAAIEETHVHQVYNKIATHFSNTRYAPWPVVSDFFKRQKPGSLGLDIGCGNGKYLDINKDLYILGSDRSESLVDIAARQRGFEVLVCDGLQTPYPTGRFDFVICIAVIHHYSSPARRVEAVEHILSLLAPAGEALLYVWALEQKASRRGWDEGDPQDVMVPWKTVEDGKEVVYERYYHLYKEGDLEADVAAASGKVKQSGYDKDNWWVVVGR
ncbi:S-adenosyl-L-methionine-dependent methyltransferase [Protomyces lactucae-debilis]|uniref:S-adenosyl-L-methionine-dependent methyltransferase n=1 Tax=Protomyces lactucae-debilis TaxID=2754530 RepID=A0A1Y2F7R3_PROLT|nr:S-adenosyl-L-methionine-dependent methyltransferase [Protomyces lactucae-debilis]ORY79960.1 S-adenosyl-L-methionine-dependent methyltransferase [Protomyces lactucae-debilis]